MLLYWLGLPIVPSLNWDKANRILGEKVNSLAVVIVMLIDINNWPYLGINNFQLMNQISKLA